MRSMTVVASAMTGLPVAMSDSRERTLASTLAWGGVCMWVLVVPFEGVRPLVHLPGQSISSAEAALLGVFLAWGVAAAGRAFTGGAWRSFSAIWSSPITLPWMAFLVTMALAALFAAGPRANALHMAGRFALAFGVFLVTVDGVTTIGRLRGVFITGAIVGAVVAVIAGLEYVGFPAALRALTVFRPGIAVVGAQVRAAGPFQYPTIASMYLEILFAFVLVLVLIAIDAHRRGGAAAAVVALAAISEAILLTFTRSGLITVGLTILIVGVWRWRARGFDSGTWAVACVAAILLVELLTSRSLGAMRLRMSTESQENWYRASIDAPAKLAFATGATTTVAVTLTNAGLTTWDSTAEHPYRLAYHWLLADADRAQIYEGLRTPFDKPVSPDETVTVFARVRAPGQPGRYRLMWDLVQEGRLWFSTEPGAELVVTQAVVSGTAVASAGATVPVALPALRPRPGRMILWGAALRMFRAHPLIGVGPDNFRLLYGEYAGLANADPRVHSNNMYLEVLAGGGLLAAAAFAWMCVTLAGVVLNLMRRAARGAMAAYAAGVSAACAAIAVHGVTDSFFSFTATYVLIAITVGLAVACDRLACTHAHRV